MYYGRDSRDLGQAKEFHQLSDEARQKLEKEFPRKEVRQTQSLYSCTWPEIVKEVKEFAKKWKKTADDVCLDHYTYDDYDGHGSSLDMVVEGLETDQQYHSRLWETYDSKRRQEEHERREFERLKAKYK